MIWVVGDSILGVHKLGRCCTVERDRIPPPTQAAAAFWGVGDSILYVHKWGRCCTVEADRIPPPTQAAAAL